KQREPAGAEHDIGNTDQAIVVELHAVPRGLGESLLRVGSNVARNLGNSSEGQELLFGFAARLPQRTDVARRQLSQEQVATGTRAGHGCAFRNRHMRLVRTTGAEL